MDIDIVLARLRNELPHENLFVSEPMEKHTSFKIGGPADILVFPQDEQEVGFVVRICNDAGVPYYIMGNGTNLLVRDNGIRGVVISTSRFSSECRVQNDTIMATAGISLSKIAKLALEEELTGLEFAGGIPGTLGGAVFMNAGAYGSEMKDVVTKTQCMKQDGVIQDIIGEMHGFGYRESVFQKENCVILKSTLKLNKGSKQDIKILMDDFNLRRKTKQPMALPSAGSVFKRPEGFYAGKLIEDCGFKGVRIGGAEVLSLHAGFIVNTGNATADDVIRLIQLIQNTVKQKFNIELQTEIKIIGEG